LLTVQDAQGRTETITCTAEHPYWVPGRGWTAAADLTAGTELTSPDGSMVVVVSNTVQVLAEPVNVYNFQVDGDHTYFVDDGAEPVWVHNTCGLGEDAEALEATAKELSTFLEGPEKGRTVAVALLSKGEEMMYVVANSSKSIVPKLVADEAKGLLIEPIKAIWGTGAADAEAKIVAWAGEYGWKLRGIGVSINYICDNCMMLLKGAGL